MNNRTSIAHTGRVHGPALTEAALCTWLGHASTGDRLAYYRGFLAIDNAPTRGDERSRCFELLRVAKRAWLLSEQGLVHLFQQRHGTDDYTYWLIMRPRLPVRSGALNRVLVAAGFDGAVAPEQRNAASWLPSGCRV